MRKISRPPCRLRAGAVYEFVYARTVFVLVPCVAIAIFRLVLAHGPMGPNPVLVKAEGIAPPA